MKPVTEDQVQMLLDGLEKREKEALKTLDRATSLAGAAEGRLTANVFRLRSKPRLVAGEAQGDVVDIASRRIERRRRMTSKGFFLYTNGPRALGQ